MHFLRCYNVSNIEFHMVISEASKQLHPGGQDFNQLSSQLRIDVLPEIVGF